MHSQFPKKCPLSIFPSFDSDVSSITPFHWSLLYRCISSTGWSPSANWRFPACKKLFCSIFIGCALNPLPIAGFSPQADFHLPSAIPAKRLAKPTYVIFLRFSCRYASNATEFCHFPITVSFLNLIFKAEKVIEKLLGTLGLWSSFLMRESTAAALTLETTANNTEQTKDWKSHSVSVPPLKRICLTKKDQGATRTLLEWQSHSIFAVHLWTFWLSPCACRR